MFQKLGMQKKGAVALSIGGAALLVAIWIGFLAKKDERSTQMVETIRNAHLALADADGSHLPKSPDSVLADSTVEGIDLNENGIRDEVELALFELYPGTKNLKIRAASLQYAKALQLYLTSVFSKETLVAALNQNDRASSCVSVAISAPSEGASNLELSNYLRSRRETLSVIDSLTFNTKKRVDRKDEIFERYMTSYGTPNMNRCDLNF